MEISHSKLIIYFFAAFLTGIFTANFFKVDLWWTTGIFIGLTIGLILLWPNSTHRFFFIIFVGFVLGLGYYSWWDWKENSKTLIYNSKIPLEGIVVSRPEFDGNIQRLVIGYRRTKIQVELSKYPTYEYGDLLKIEGRIEDPNEIKTRDGFNYGEYLLKHGIRGTIRNPVKIEKIGFRDNKAISLIYKIGESFQNVLNKTLVEPYASLQSGLVLGNKSNIPDSLMSSFNRTGTTHVVAVSGFNITIIISIISVLLASISRKLSFWGTIVTIVGFIVLTGASASVIRAGILGGFAAWGRLEGRRLNHAILILFTASVMLLFNPYALLNDVSFQLSFLAFVGLLIVSPVVEQNKIFIKLPSKIRTILAETLGAQVLVLPILIYNFGTLSLISPIANVLILSPVVWAMFAGIGLGIIGLVWLKLAQILAFANWVVLKYIFLVVDYLGNLSFAAISLPKGEWWWIPSYYLILWVIFARKKNKAEEVEEEW